MYSALLLVLVFMLQGLQSLKDVRLELPTAVKTGSFMTLSCVYHLDRDTLYTVKFYLEDTEFFRFVPRDRPPTMVFPLPDSSVHLQMNSINRSVVTLGPVNRGLAGLYKCEVTEEPLFHTIIKSSFVTVTEDPVSRPSLVTSKGVYGEGDTVTARCISRGGHPPVNFTWFLDDKRISNTYGTDIRNYMVTGDVDTSVSELRLTVTPSTLSRRELRLRCVTSQFDVYYAIADRTLKNTRFSTSSPTNRTANNKSLIVFPNQSLSLMLLFLYCVSLFSIT